MRAGCTSGTPPRGSTTAVLIGRVRGGLLQGSSGVSFSGAARRHSVDAEGRGILLWGASGRGGNPTTPSASGSCGSGLAVRAYLLRHGRLDPVVRTARLARCLPLRLQTGEGISTAVLHPAARAEAEAMFGASAAVLASGALDSAPLWWIGHWTRHGGPVMADYLCPSPRAPR